MKNTIIVDYQLGNLFSVNQALTNIGLNVKISSNAKDIEQADAIVLPGVGAFKDAMANLHTLDLVKPIVDFVKTTKPFLGVCLGLQLLFSESEEFGSAKGLDLISGAVKRFNNYNKEGERVKVPQITWNTIHKINTNWESTPLQSLQDKEYMYFVHSFFVSPEKTDCILSITSYGGVSYTSSILYKNIFACQFHPEKSASKGLLIYKDWAQLNNLI